MRSAVVHTQIALAVLGAAVTGCSGDAPAAGDASTHDAVTFVDGSVDATTFDAAVSDLGVAVDIGRTDAPPDARDGGDATTTIGDAGADAVSVDAPADTGPSLDPDASAVTCEGRPAGCATGTAGGACGDALVGPDCVDGAWRCPSGTIPVTQCACLGRPPGACFCASTGWQCPDAG